MGDAMKGVTKAMAQMNRQLNLPGLQRIMQEFERQNERMEMVSEVMGDAIDDALEGDEEEEETEELVNQVLDEIGIDINQEVITVTILQFSHVVVPINSFNLIRYYCNIIFCTYYLV
jgi:charged multivesicular body protein 2A